MLPATASAVVGTVGKVTAVALAPPVNVVVHVSATTRPLKVMVPVSAIATVAEAAAINASDRCLMFIKIFLNIKGN